MERACLPQAGMTRIWQISTGQMRVSAGIRLFHLEFRQLREIIKLLNLNVYVERNSWADIIAIPECLKSDWFLVMITSAPIAKAE